MKLFSESREIKGLHENINRDNNKDNKALLNEKFTEKEHNDISSKENTVSTTKPYLSFSKFLSQSFIKDETSLKLIEDFKNKEFTCSKSGVKSGNNGQGDGNGYCGDGNFSDNDHSSNTKEAQTTNISNNSNNMINTNKLKEYKAEYFASIIPKEVDYSKISKINKLHTEEEKSTLLIYFI